MKLPLKKIILFGGIILAISYIITRNYSAEFEIAKHTAKSIDKFTPILKDYKIMNYHPLVSKFSLIKKINENESEYFFREAVTIFGMDFEITRTVAKFQSFSAHKFSFELNIPFLKIYSVHFKTIFEVRET